MILEVDRFKHGSDSSLGIFKVNGIFECFVCEDEHRDKKVHGETRIPEGCYLIKLRNEGGMTKRYASKFPNDHKGMLHLQNVPNFEYVYIHIGNTDDDSLGCLLVGKGAVSTLDGGTVSNSTGAYIDLYRKIVDAMDSGETVQIIIKNR